MLLSNTASTAISQSNFFSWKRIKELVALEVLLRLGEIAVIFGI